MCKRLTTVELYEPGNGNNVLSVAIRADGAVAYLDRTNVVWKLQPKFPQPKQPKGFRKLDKDTYETELNKLKLEARR